MTAIVDGDQAEFVGEAAVQLRRPGQMALHEAMDQQDWRAVWVTPFAGPNFRSSAAPYQGFAIHTVRHAVASRQILFNIVGPSLAM